jgi:NitT/TauT family transport system substrate-binding protein
MQFLHKGGFPAPKMRNLRDSRGIILDVYNPISVLNNGAKFGIAAAVIIAVILTSLPGLGLRAASNTGQTVTEQSDLVRIGYFPNINHAQAVIGVGGGEFQKELGSVVVKGQVFSVGPAIIEAMLARQVDIAYVGPNPAINGYIVSNGSLLRVISGATTGGAVFVVRNDAGIQTAADFAGKKFASPALGNTQDVALRKYLADNGYDTRKNDGNVEILPAKPSDIVTLMLKKQIDGAWVPEPWGAKLVKEANSRIFLDERSLWENGEFASALIIVRTSYLEQNPEIVRKFLNAHIEQTEWINDNPEQAVKTFNEELRGITGNTIPEDELVEGLSRMELTYDPVEESLYKTAEDAIDVGFLDSANLEGIFALDLLNQVLAEKGLDLIE